MEFLRVEIDIKPGDSPNSINPRSRGVIPVGIYGTEEFDVIDVNVSTLAFGPGHLSASALPGEATMSTIALNTV